MPVKKFVSMELSDEEKIDMTMPIAMPDRPSYPPGLRISLTDRDLARLDLEDMPRKGDTLELEVLAVVTAVHDGEGGCYVELQIQQIETESDDDEG